MKKKLLKIAIFTLFVSQTMNIANAQSISKSSGAPTPLQNEFSSATWNYPTQISGKWRGVYNDSRINRMFVETLRLKVPKGCKVVKANFQIRVKNLGAQNYNDSLYMLNGGANLFGQKVWTNEPQGATKLLSYNLANLPTGGSVISRPSASILHTLNDGKFSFFVQDDTSVQSVKLNYQLRGRHCRGSSKPRKPIKGFPVPINNGATNTKQCTFKGVHGNWGPQHNTRKWNYQIVKGGKDYYLHRKGRRTVGLKCGRGESYVIDHYSNGKDACKKCPTSGGTSSGSSSLANKCHKYLIKPKKPTYSYNGVHGNWGPQHNTKKWNYQTVKGGKDYYLHRKGKRTVGLKCGRGETYINDHYSNGKDACRVQTGLGNCPSGYKGGQDNKCYKLIGSTSAIQKVTRVHGNWGPQHNTKKWSYQTVKGGKDYYLRNKGNRTVGMKCGKYETYKVDYYSNGKDACISTKLSCPTGYRLD